MTLVATQVKRRRGTGAENDAFTGAEGEITVDLTNKELRVHTGDNKVGGYGLARKDFENITDEAKNISNWSSNVSNCITNIPQDIKLELNNGTLTLKAGSKLYVPNGSGTFDILTLTADKTATQTTNDTRLYFYNGTYIEKFPVAQCYSGDTAPSGNTYMFWYDTTNNVVKKTSNSGATWESGWSLPFCIATASSGALTSIDHVFNGFGYIGSTVFALPDVKGLKPSGRNSDGSLKNVEFTVSNVIIQANTAQSLTLDFVVRQDGVSGGISGLDWNYNEAENQIYNSVGGKANWIPCVRFVADSNSKIISFAPKTAFHAVDYNEADFVVDFQRPTADNNYTWYRKYKSGWVEQGRFFTNSTTIPYGSQGDLGGFYFPIPMQNNRYFATASGQGYCILMQADRSTTYYKPMFGTYTTDRTLTGVSVYVCGLCAQ